MSAQQLKEFIRGTLNELENAVRNEKWTLVQTYAGNIVQAAAQVELIERWQDESGCVLSPRGFPPTAAARHEDLTKTLLDIAKP